MISTSTTSRSGVSRTSSMPLLPSSAWKTSTLYRSSTLVSEKMLRMSSSMIAILESANTESARPTLSTELRISLGRLSTRWCRNSVVSLRSEEHTSELQSLMRISYAVFCLKKKNNHASRDKHTTSSHQP